MVIIHKIMMVLYSAWELISWHHVTNVILVIRIEGKRGGGGGQKKVHVIGFER